MDRFNKLRKRLAKEKLDAILLSKIVNIQYLTGFTGDIASLIITGSAAYFITDSIYITQARDEVKGCKIIESKGMVKAIANVVAQEKIKRLGYEASMMLHKDLGLYKKVLKGVELSGTTGVVEEIRMIKDVEEIALIKKATEIAEFALYKTLNFFHDGISEKDIAIELEYRLKKGGAEAIAFPTIIASGYRGALPHGAASEKPIKKGELVVIDFGCVYKGYCSDLTRTVSLGIIDRRLKASYKVVYEAQQAALSEIACGVKLSAIDKKARNLLKKHKVDRNFTHGIGHGLGREVHEMPRVSFKSDTTAKPGMVFTVEPGIYFPGDYGIRIENIAVVTENGFEMLGKDQKELTVI